MKILIAGGTGFLGRPLARALLDAGHDVVILTREPHSTALAIPDARYVTWNAVDDGPWTEDLDGSAVVVNLSGESIAGRRWSPRHKQRILASRVASTKLLGEVIRQAARPPQTFISASAVGYYGPQGEQPVTEDHPAGSDFLAGVCVAWEAAAAEAPGRVACIRTGLVLHGDGGALAQMLLPFKFGVGGPLGSGRQYWPWIHRDDWVALVQWIIDTPAVRGPVNATAPNPVTNGAFSRALGRALRRPALMPAPAFALKAALGEMAEALLLSGQRAIPAKAAKLGFRFRYTEIDAALGEIFGAQPAGIS